MAAKAAFPVKAPGARLLRMKLPPAVIHAKIRCKINCLTSSLLRMVFVCGKCRNRPFLSGNRLLCAGKQAVFMVQKVVFYRVNSRLLHHQRPSFAL